MNLDDKLREVIYGWVTADMDVTEEEHIDKMVAQIKQAFAEAGWSDGFNGPKISKMEIDNKEVMTGQEWYDRFTKALAGEVFPFSSETDEEVIDLIDKCKKAAGL